MRGATCSVRIAYTPWDARRPFWLRTGWMHPGRRHEPYVPAWVDLQWHLFHAEAPSAGAVRVSVQSPPNRSARLFGYSESNAVAFSVPFRERQ